MSQPFRLPWHHKTFLAATFRTPANIKIPLLSGCTCPACSSSPQETCTSLPHMRSSCQVLCGQLRSGSSVWEPINGILKKSRKEMSVLLLGDTDGRGFRRRLIIKQGCNSSQLVMPAHRFLGWAENLAMTAKLTEILIFCSARVSISFSVLIVNRQGSWINREVRLSLSTLQARRQVNCSSSAWLYSSMSCAWGIAFFSQLLTKTNSLMPVSWLRTCRSQAQVAVKAPK